MAFVGGISALIALLVLVLVRLSKEELDDVSKLISNGMILLIFFAIIAGAVYKKSMFSMRLLMVQKEGFNVA